VTIPNIGPRGRRQRLRFGFFFLAVSVALGIALVALHAPRGWRAALFVPAWLAALGFFQARDKT
jgi:hypothetical protein